MTVTEAEYPPGTRAVAITCDHPGCRAGFYLHQCSTSVATWKARALDWHIPEPSHAPRSAHCPKHQETP